MKNIQGLVFSNMHEHMVSELTPHRCMGSVPVGGRYRMIDFVLSTFANSGIEDVGVITKTNYQSLMDHLGNGREWDLSRKSGGLVILPPFSQTDSGMYRSRIEAIYGVMGFLKASPSEYVVTSDCDMLFNTTFDDMFISHVDSGADITLMYKKMPLEADERDTCVLQVGADGLVEDVLVEPPQKGEHNVYLNVMLISKSLLEYLVGNCYSRNQFSFERDLLQASAKQYKVNAFEYEGFVHRFSSLQTYYAANLSLLDSQIRNDLFPQNLPVYTKVRDDAPVRYGLNAKVKNTLLADGCLIEGEVENSVLFRGVTVGKGVKVKNSVIMQGTTIGDNSSLECVVADKNVSIREGRMIMGFHTYPVYIAKGSVV